MTPYAKHRRCAYPTDLTDARRAAIADLVGACLAIGCIRDENRSFPMSWFRWRVWRTVQRKSGHTTGKAALIVQASSLAAAARVPQLAP